MIDSGSARNARSTCSAPTGIHVKITSTCERSSALIAEQVDVDADRDDERRGRPSAWRSTRRAARRGGGRTSRMIRNPASGKAGINQSTSSTARQPFNSARSSAVAPGRARRIDTRMPRPTTTSNERAGQDAWKSGDEEDLGVDVLVERNRRVERARQADRRRADERRQDARDDGQCAETDDRRGQAAANRRVSHAARQRGFVGGVECNHESRPSGTTVRWPASS